MSTNTSSVSKHKNKNKKRKNIVTLGHVHIFVSFNNTIVTVTDAHGNAICASSAGANGFKGNAKSTPHAAQKVVEKVLGEAKERGLKTAYLFIKGPGLQREYALRSVINFPDVLVTSITDRSSVAHNGCKPRKKRRV
jgi:small subunit ribosomal protein S11